MKNPLILASVVCAFFVASCSQDPKNSSDQAEVEDVLKDSVCYASTFEADKANMVLKNYESGKVGGSLNIDNASGKNNIGTLNGKFRGDTLFVDYKFTSGTKDVFTNPLAFLKKDDKLIMGVGQIETTMGRSYFVKDKPINFEVGKFVFEEENCK